MVAAAAALFVWLIAEALMSEPILVPESPGSSVRTELAAGAVIGAAVFAGIAGWLSLAVLERFVDRAARAWTGLALVVLVVSMPWVGEFSAAERVALAGMHLAVGAVLVSGLVATAKRR